VDGDDEVDVLEHLDSLVRKSLVVADHTTTRYGLFETIRQFAEDRLSEAGALERLEIGMLRTSLARPRLAGASGRLRRDAVDWVELELANLRAGFRWSAARGELDCHRHRALPADGPPQLLRRSRPRSCSTPPAADVARLPRLYTGAGYVLCRTS
jgi:predicted ATPase